MSGPGARGRALAAAGVVAAILGAATLAGCASSTQGPTTEPSSSASAGQSTSGGTGDVVEPGEPVEVAVDGGTLRLVLDSVELATSCPGRGVPTQVPSFAYFLVLEVTATLEGDATAADGAATAAGGETAGGGVTPAALYASLGAEMFRIAAPDGTLQTISTTAESWECYPDAELLPAFVDGGETVSGKVVLDAMTEHGTVSYAPRGESDWHWVF